MEKPMSTATTTQSKQVDQFFTVAEARFDRWRGLLEAARNWEGAGSQPNLEKELTRAAVSTSLQELRQWEDFFAYPGPTLIRTLEERITSGDATGTTTIRPRLHLPIVCHGAKQTPLIDLTSKCS
jgi:arginine decarboxylase